MTLFITSSPFDEAAETPLFSNANGFVTVFGRHFRNTPA